MDVHTSRRGFLKHAATAAAAVGFPAIIPAQAIGASEKIAVGCIGVGGMGTGNTKSQFLPVGDCRVVAVCDARRERMERAKGIVDETYGDKGCAMIGDYRELLARKDIDAVMIATQDHWHALIATAAAAAGKDMYCEKPMGVCVGDSQAIRAAVRKHQRVFQAGTWQRSKGNFRQGCELVRNGYIGKLTEIQVAAPGPTYQPKYEGSFDPQPVPEGFDWTMWQGSAPLKPFNPGRVAHPDWYLIWDYCAGFICNWGVHHLDIAYWGCPSIGSEPFEVECRGVFRKKGFTDNIESWSATFAFASGLRMVFKDNKQMKSGTHFIGERGTVHVDRGNDTASTEPASLASLRPKSSDLRLLPSGFAGDDIAVVKRKDGDTIAYKNLSHGEDFLQCVRSRKDPLSNVDATHYATIFGLIAEIAARMEKKLKWDPKSERFIGNDEANRLLVRQMHNGWKLGV